MLCITLKPGDYFTMGGDTVVQFDRITGERIHLAVHAPQTVPILRGEVLERQGGKRPECVSRASPHAVRQLPWSRAKSAALAEMRATLDKMSDTPEVRILRRKLNLMFPQPQGG